MERLEILQQTKARLDTVSPSFCLAKWLQVTLHLQNGFNHSCHHPISRQASADEVAQDPSALHNTSFKKEMRELMLKGERPQECHFCWEVEDAPGGHFSDRILKSSTDWAEPELERVAGLDSSQNVNPTYLEVSFGNECNFRCVYCDPTVSSSIWNAYEKHGHYVGRTSLIQYRAEGRAPLKSENNPYVRAFWEWFPALAPNLKVFRITGGEPLLNPNTYRMLDFLEQYPQPNLQLCINSNFGVPERQFQTFIERIKALTFAGKIRDFIIYTSADTHGTHAEYLRVGLDYSLWLERVRRFLGELPWRIVVMVTFSALSVPRFSRLLDDVQTANHDFPREKKRPKRVTLDVAHLWTPEYLSPWTLDESWLHEITKLADLMGERNRRHVGPDGFSDHEINKMRRLADWAGATAQHSSKDVAHYRALFFLFTEQFEEREGKKFLEVFPEMESYYETCKSAFTAQGKSFKRLYSPSSLEPPEISG